MDEPFGAIDPKNRLALQEILLKLWDKDGESKKKTVVFVTHDIDEAIFLADRIVIFSASPGRVYEEIKVPFKRPRNRSELFNSIEFNNLRSRILSHFYEDDKKDESEDIAI